MSAFVSRTAIFRSFSPFELEQRNCRATAGNFRYQGEVIRHRYRKHFTFSFLFFSFFASTSSSSSLLFFFVLNSRDSPSVHGRISVRRPLHLRIQETVPDCSLFRQKRETRWDKDAGNEGDPIFSPVSHRAASSFLRPRGKPRETFRGKCENLWEIVNGADILPDRGDTRKRGLSVAMEFITRIRMKIQMNSLQRKGISPIYTFPARERSLSNYWWKLSKCRNIRNAYKNIEYSNKEFVIVSKTHF